MELRPVLKILADGAFHSGEQIGRDLSISRTAVWKQVDKLRRVGVDIHSVTGKGYRLPAAICLLDAEQILSHIGEEAYRWKSDLHVSFSTLSTNKDALAAAQSGRSSAVFVAEHQERGRGRRGRTWVSPAGSNIYFSMLFTFAKGVAELEGLSLAVAVIVVDALSASGYDGFQLKWPNDVLRNSRKLAGILLEVTGDVAGPCKVVIGVGINVRVSGALKSQVDQPVAGLVEGASDVPDRNLIVANLVRELQRGIAEFERHGFEPFRGPWQSIDAFKGQVVRIGLSSDWIEGRVMGVDNRGALQLETESGVKLVSSGELAPSVRAL
jgi:BirA family biotin operon repressor/biotin-[acetyl-CoA-carboxylase] ligase